MSTGLAGESVSRNYAEALLALANKANDAAGWCTMLRQVADAIESDSTLRQFLDSPRIPADNKSKMLARALGDRIPRNFLRFLESLVRNRRQTMIPQIASEFETLLDASNGIVHARVTVARETSEDEKASIASRLSKITGRTVVPHLNVDAAILGGVVVRIGDTVMDGSVRRKLGLLRRRLA